MQTSSLIVALLVIAAPTFTLAADAEPAGAPKKRILLLSQGPDGHPPATHEYRAGQKVLMKLLGDVPGLEVVPLAADGAWEEGPEQLAKADGAFLFLSEGGKWLSADPRRHEAFAKLAQRKGGLAALHWATGVREAEPVPAFLKLFGACHGGPDRKYQVLEAKLHVVDPRHPISRGLADFAVKDEFYYKLKRASADEPKFALASILEAEIDGERQMVAWAWQRPDGGRSFGFTGLHFHNNWSRPEYRRLVAQGILWMLDLPIPKEGLKVDASEEDWKLPEAKEEKKETEQTKTKAKDKK